LTPTGPAKRGGHKRSIDVREVLNGIFYVLWTGCQWKALPKDLPPKSTAHYYFMLWAWDGTLERIRSVSLLVCQLFISTALHCYSDRIRSHRRRDTIEITPGSICEAKVGKRSGQDARQPLVA